MFKWFWTIVSLGAPEKDFLRCELVTRGELDLFMKCYRISVNFFFPVESQTLIL